MERRKREIRNEKNKRGIEEKEGEEGKKRK